MYKLKSFKPIPFYFFNDEFSKEEIITQLDCMKDNGVDAFFLHVRDGITTEAYGTETFFLNVRFIVERAKERGIKVWLYDEDSYPSGNFGGKTVIDHPELLAYKLVVDKIEIKNGFARKNLGKVKGLYGYIIDKNGVRTKSNCFGTVREIWYRRDMDKAYYHDMGDLRHEHVRAATCYTDIMFETSAPDGAEVYAAYLAPVKTDMRYGTQADCLNKKTTEYFIANTHKKYAEYVGEYFGNQIPGIFIDEPAIGGALAYTDELPSYFKKRFGYEIKDNLYKLCATYTGETASFRRDYITAIGELFRKNFIAPIKKWCEKNNLILTGHFSGEEDIVSQTLCGNNIYQALKYMDIVGFDIISNNVGDYNHPALIMGARIPVSVIAQRGGTSVMCESFALNPFNFGYQGLKQISDWLFVCGINLIVPHAFFYGYSAMQRGDAGKSFFFQDPDFESEYVKYAKYAERACDILNEYQDNAKVCLVLPYDAMAEEVPFPVSNAGYQPRERAISIKERLQDLIRFLIVKHIQFDVADTATLLSSKVVKGKTIIGKKQYEKIIVVAGGEIEDSLYNNLRRRNATCVLFSGKDNLGLENDKVSVEVGDGKNLMVLEKVAKDGELTFVYNNSKDYVKFSLNGAKGVVYNLETGEKLKFNQPNFALNGYESLMIISNETSSKTYDIPQPKRVILTHKQNPQWVYMPKGAKQAVTEFNVSVLANGEEKSFNRVKFARLRDLMGTFDDVYKKEYVVPYFDTAKRQQSFYPVKATFTAKIDGVKGASGILFDKGTFSGDFEIYFNGEKIDKSKFMPRRVYDKSNIFVALEWKENNVLEISFSCAGEFDGVNGEVYIY